MDKINYKDIRSEYESKAFSESELLSDPLKLAEQWLDTAIRHDLEVPNAMTLCTADISGVPSSRIVLLKGLSDAGFEFYTNYSSRKGQELEQNPYAAATFFWKEINRQLCIIGKVNKLSKKTSQAYFASRPRGSQISAAISQQSHETTLDGLNTAWKNFDGKYSQQPIPMPESWGGYCIQPIELEFWQGRPNRLHDRFRYRKQENGDWQVKRLAP